jgi:hypothetical protein
MPYKSRKNMHFVAEIGGRSQKKFGVKRYSYELAACNLLSGSVSGHFYLLFSGYGN